MFDKKKYMKKYRQKNKKRIKKYNKKYNQEHKSEIQACQKKYNELYWSNYWAKNKDEINKQRKENYIHKPKIIYSEEERKKRKKECQREYQRINSKRINTSEKGRARHLKYFKKRYKTDFRFKLNSNMAVAIGQSLKGKKAGRRWEILVGYALKDLIKRLKKTIPEGYTWQDYIDGKLEIDHICPISVFNFTRAENIDFKRCWALKNLQLLPVKENRVKYNRLDKPFQPALAIDF